MMGRRCPAFKVPWKLKLILGVLVDGAVKRCYSEISFSCVNLVDLLKLQTLLSCFEMHVTLDGISLMSCII